MLLGQQHGGQAMHRLNPAHLHLLQRLAALVRVLCCLVHCGRPVQARHQHLMLHPLARCAQQLGQTARRLRFGLPRSASAPPLQDER